MEEHFCDWVLEWELVTDAFADEPNQPVSFSRPLEVCGKPARFETGLGTWYCAEHWDIHTAERERLKKVWEEYDQGICKICNCEFYNGECNCQYYQFG